MTRKGAAFLLGLVVFGAVLSFLFHQGLIKGSETDLSFLTGAVEAAPNPTPATAPEPAPVPKDPAPATTPNLEPRNPTLEDYLAAVLLAADENPIGELDERVRTAYEVAAAMVAIRMEPSQTSPNE